MSKAEQHMLVCAAAAVSAAAYAELESVWGAAYTGDYGHAPVHAAAIGGNCELLRQLIHRDPSQLDEPDALCGRTPLMCAAAAQVRPRLRRARDDHDLSMAYPCSAENDESLAMEVESVQPMAFGERQVGAAVMLMEMGASVAGVADFHGRTALEWIAVGKSDALFKRALALVDVNARLNKKRATLLMTAVANDLPDRARALLELGADPNLAMTDGTTALHVAVEARSERCIRVLAPVACRRALNDQWETPRLVAVRMNAPKRVQAMLSEL
jgi:ankyrin repeat protein